MKSVAKFLLIAVPWVVLLFLGGVYMMNRLFSFPWVYQEIGRVRSPDAKHEAVILGATRGAMSSFRYAVCIVTPGQHFDTERVNFDSSDLQVTNVTWTSPTRLCIRQGPERIYYYKPLWPDDPEKGARNQVEVELKIDFQKPVTP